MSPSRRMPLSMPTPAPMAVCMLLAAPGHQKHVQWRARLHLGPSTHTCQGLLHSFRHLIYLIFFYVECSFLFCCNCGQYTCPLSPSSSNNKKTAPTFSRYVVCYTCLGSESVRVGADTALRISVGCYLWQGPKPSI